MLITFEYRGDQYQADLSKPLDISIPLIPNEEGVNCFYAPKCKAEPVRAGSFVGSIEEGGSLNFKNLFVNPHGNGTHTECVEHISSQNTSINKALTRFHFIGELVTVSAEKRKDDFIITKKEVLSKIKTDNIPEALILRTETNGPEKLKKNYSGTNPTYCDPRLIRSLKKKGVKHLLLDLPSVDREEDGGKLESHKAFWNVPEKPEKNHTITELIYVPDEISDGLYLINIQIISLEMDASPSKVLLYKLTKI